MKLLFLLACFQLYHHIIVTANTNINVNFAGLIPPSCPMSCPECPATSVPSTPDVEEYFALNTDVRPEDIEAEYFGIYRPEGQEEGTEAGQGTKRGAIATCQAPIAYYGGPVMSGSNVLYLVYYGELSAYHANGSNAVNNKTKTLIDQFLLGLSNSAYYNMTTQYSSMYESVLHLRFSC
jgi:hypothetical protein